MAVHLKISIETSIAKQNYMFPSYLRQKKKSETDSTHGHKHTSRLTHNTRNNMHPDNAKLAIATPAKYNM